VLSEILQVNLMGVSTHLATDFSNKNLSKMTNQKLTRQPTKNDSFAIKKSVRFCKTR
jgi:hypothetical protein